jgi:hypothetical protein
MSAFRTGCFFAGSVALGFAVGWYLHQPQHSSRLAPPEPSHSAVTAEVQPKPTVVQPKVEQSIDDAWKDAPPLNERLATLRWLKKTGLFVPVQIFTPEGISPQFALLYGLTQAEQTQLSLAFKQAKQRLEELSSQRAQVDPTTTAEKLIVSVPAFPTEGGRIYNDLLANFASVMGADRYPVFNETSGNLLENSLEGIGLATNRYEVTLGETTLNDQPTYDIKRSFLYPSESGSSSGTSNSRLGLSDVLKFFPLLKSYPLPSAPSSGSSR